MSHRRQTGLKENRIIVAISLLGLDVNGRRRTQNEVAVALGYPKSTVSECVRDLLNGGYIIESGKTRKEKIYARGAKFCLLESQISDEIRQKMRNLMSVRIDSPPISTPDRAGVSDVSSSGENRLIEIGWRIHLPGDMLQFAVDREGAIDRVAVSYRDPDTGRERTRWQTIFYGEPYELPGSVNWSTSFVIDGHPGQNRFTMRYQKSATGKWFYVNPEFPVIVDSQTAIDADMMRRAFVTKCTPLLNWLQKKAGWRFAVDGNGMYDLLTEIDLKKVHRAMCGEANDIITEVTDGAFVGNDEAWCDNSLGYPEMETSSVDFVEAVVDMVDTRRKIDSVWADMPRVKEDMARFRTDLDTLRSDIDELLDISKKLYEVSLNIVKTETNTMKVLSRSQTTLDNLPTVPGTYDPEHERRPKFPMEGYQ